MLSNDDIDGIINALGAGVPTRFTAINAKSDDDLLVSRRQTNLSGCMESS